MGKGLMLLVAMLTLAGCDAWKQAYGDFCDVAEPHFHTTAALKAMKPKQVATEVKHNEYGEAKCGWKANSN